MNTPPPPAVASSAVASSAGAPQPGASHERGALAARLAGLATIAVVALPTAIGLFEQPERFGHPAVVGATFCLGTFAVLFWWLTSPAASGRHPPVFVVAALATMSGLAVAFSLIDRNGLAGILLVLVASLLVDVMPIGVVLLWVATQTLAFGLALAATPGGGHWSTLISTLAFSGFQAFAVYTTWVARREREARGELSRTNGELVATQHLLAESSRAAERGRIARELHDVLGHHLTALSLRLEAARHTDGAVRGEHLDVARAGVAELLGEVRKVVAELRDEPTVDLVPALTALIHGHSSAAPRVGPLVTATLPDRLELADPARAHALLRAVQELLTNARRHAAARQVEVVLATGVFGLEPEVSASSSSTSREVLHLLVRDDGRGDATIIEGHGLRGLRERLADFDGELELTTSPGEGLTARVTLPIAGEVRSGGGSGHDSTNPSTDGSRTGWHGLPS